MAVVVELPEGEMAILAFAVVVVSERLDQGNGVGHGLGHFREPDGDIKGLVHIAFCCFFIRLLINVVKPTGCDPWAWLDISIHATTVKLYKCEPLSWQVRQDVASPIG